VSPINKHCGIDDLFIYADNPEYTMADVTGSIGNDYVELNNAATEATLRLILQATLSTTKAQKDAIKELATKAGLDPAAVAAMNTNVKQSTSVFSKLATAGTETANKIRVLDGSISPLIKSLTDGTAQVSNVFSAFEQLPGILGVVATGLRRLAEFQEKNLSMYQEITSAGVNFGGSLTQMRQAALNTYLTLDQFQNLMKTNSDTFARMGGTTNDGAKAFVALSNTLNKSQLGNDLRNLGYTTEQVNQGMANYISMTGGRSKAELQNSAAIIKSSGEYLTQLDMLAEITGKNRTEAENELKEKAKNSAWEAKLAGMSEEEKKKAIAGLANALAVGGKGAADAFQSKVMGVPPITKEAQAFTATMGKTNESVMRSAKNVTDSTKTVQDQNKELVKGIRANEQDVKKFPLAMQYAMGAMGSETAKQIQESQGRANRSAKQDDESYARALDTEAKKKELAASEAARAVASQKSMQEFGQAINNLLGPIVSLLTPVVNALATALSKVVKGLDTGFGTLVMALGAAVLAINRFTAAKTAEAIKDAAGGAGGAGGGAGKGAGSLVKKLGLAGTVIGGLMLAGELSNVSEQEKAGSISKEEADKQRGGAKGEFAGGLAGAAAGAAAGALMGGPIGALIGGLIGGYGGGTAGRMGGEAIAGPQKMASGGVVTQPTLVEAGEAGSEAIIPLYHLESLKTELQTLNKQTADVITYLKETAEFSRRNYDATRSLSGDLFKF
jgi:hypothetical protein